MAGANGETQAVDEESGVVKTSISFKREVLERTDAIGAKLERSRSWLVNKALEQYLPQFEEAEDCLQKASSDG